MTVREEKLEALIMDHLRELLQAIKEDVQDKVLRDDSEIKKQLDVSKYN